MHMAGGDAQGGGGGCTCILCSASPLGTPLKVVIENFANFLSISPNPNKDFPLCLLVPAGTFLLFRIQSLRFLNPEGYQLNYRWISGLRIFKLLNLCGNQLLRKP
jgi:hypothetical protein